MYSWPPLTPSSSRLGRTEMVMASLLGLGLDEVDVAVERSQLDRGPDPLDRFDVGEEVTVLDSGVAAGAVGKIAHGQAPLGRAVSCVGNGVGGDGAGSPRFGHIGDPLDRTGVEPGLHRGLVHGADRA